MAKLGVLAFALFCVCPAGHAEDSRDLSALTFWPQPMSAPVLPLGPRDATAVASSERGADASQQSDRRNDAQQPESREELAAAVATQLSAIEAEQARNGDRSPELIAPLSSLAFTYQKLGEYASADAALQHAIEIARINFGLHSLDQADVVESLVATRQTNGDYGGAAEKRRYLRELVSRNSDDPRVVAILSELAGQEMDDARRLVGVPAPAQIGMTSGGGGFGVAPRTPSLAALHAAQSDYIAAIQAAVRTHTGNAADVFALQDALSDTVYFQLAHPEILGPGHVRSAWYGVEGPPGYPTLGYTGERILRHKALDSMSFQRSPMEVAKDLLALADWYLVFGSYEGAPADYQSKSYGPAFDTYRMARDVLVRSNVPGDTIDELVSPELPPAVPVLPETIVGTVHDRVLRGYIDASVEITRFGDVKRIEVLGRSTAVTKDIVEQLRHYVAARTFRPRFVNGEIPRMDRFAARFYFD